MKTTQTMFNRIFAALQFCLMTLVLSLTIQAAGEVDPTFNTNVGRFAMESVNALALQPDGKILVVGNFTTVNGLPRTGVARFNSDGSLDASFNVGEILQQNGTGAIVNVIALQADGKILIAGNFNTIAGTQRPTLARLNSDGSLDNSFVTGSSTTTFINGSVNAVSVQPDGKILVGGDFNIQTIVQGMTITRSNLVRYNSDGTYDATFNFNPPGNVADIVVQPDGKIIIGGSFGSVARLNADGSVDATFTNLTVVGNTVSAMILQPDGKIVVVGSFTTFGGVAQGYITRLNANGTLDTTFNAGNAGANNTINDVALTPDGKVVIVGRFTTYNGASASRVARLNADGSLDTTFNYAAIAAFTPTDVVVQPDGRIVIAGVNSTAFQPGSIFRLNQNGSVDASFPASIAFVTPATVQDIYVQSDGKTLVSGNFTVAGGVTRVFLVRLNSDGSVDPSFVPNINIGTGVGGVYAIAQQSDGKVIVGGELGADLQRLNVDGSRDLTFAPTLSNSGSIFAVAVQPDGKILVGGNLNTTNPNQVNLLRLNADGSVDTSFNVNVSSYIIDIFLQPDGKIIIGGSFTSVNGAARGRIARLNADGTLDLSFNPSFGANNFIYTVALQPDGKILAAGDFTTVNGVNRAYLARFNPNGSLDSTFVPNLNSSVYSIALQPDGRILIGGAFTLIDGVTRNRYARLNPGGSIDFSFNSSIGANNIASEIALLPDGKVLIGGNFTQVGGQPHIGLARLINAANSRTRFDFDGDGRADVAVFRPSNGNWYILQSSNSAFNAVQFGQGNDQIAPADYDSDGRTDIAVFRGAVPGAGNLAYFYILNSSNNSFVPVQFGATGDVPVSGDWDGDGKADLAVYRDGSLAGGQSSFYYRPSSQPGVNFRTIQWGATGDKPLVGDFDGDGRLDAAVFRPSTATWYILRSSNNQVIQTTFGLSTDIPVSADYDGDGIANIAVFRPSTGTWFTSQNPATNYGAVQFGASGDLPVPADYDGDGRADVAVFRPSTGAWYLNRSTSGFAGVAFGAATDKPVPNAYVP
jgi:uncharacterized delta-60 repeat protein